jgi:hypothetical protein
VRIHLNIMAEAHCTIRLHVSHLSDVSGVLVNPRTEWLVLSNCPEELADEAKSTVPDV